MELPNENITKILSELQNMNVPDTSERYAPFRLKFNPFPKSGTAYLQNSTDYLLKLPPLNEIITKRIQQYILATLFSETNNDDKYMGAIVLGDYGAGKTQLLMFIKSLLEIFATSKKYHQNPCVIYIDNPGVKLSELIGNIIAQIGEENFKKFLWNKIIKLLEERYRLQLDAEFPRAIDIFGEKANPWDNSNKVSYKKFIDAWIQNINIKPKLKNFEDKMKDYIMKVLISLSEDTVVTQYFYKILIDDLGFNLAWDAVTKGDVRNLSGKEASIIKFMVDLLKEEGFTHVYVLVDEFEDITRGRLSKVQVDNYLYSLRTLIDKERNWTIMFAMTYEAFASLQATSPPLADRISAFKIELTHLNDTEAKRLIRNYLVIARDEEKDNNFPFDESAIAELIRITKGNPRLLISSCFKLLELGVANKLKVITSVEVKNEIDFS